jgi:hypothetical protein
MAAMSSRAGGTRSSDAPPIAEFEKHQDREVKGSRAYGWSGDLPEQLWMTKSPVGDIHRRVC